MNADDKITAILRMEADTVEPSPAGWDAIQQGLTARRSRTWWTLGAAVAGSAALVIGAVVFVGTADRREGREVLPATESPNVESPTSSPSATPPATSNAPIHAIWPLTTDTEVAAWQADNTTYPSLATASNSALAFARNYLGVADADIVALEGSFGENKFEVRRDGAVVSTVTVKGFGADGTAPFVATLAEAPDLRISSPAAASAVPGSFTAQGPYEAVDPAIDVTLRADTTGSAPVELDKARATTGPGGWTAPMSYETDARTGSLLVTNASLRDEGIGSAAAIPLTFGLTPVEGPKAMVAARDGRIAVLSTTNGSVVRWLTEQLPGGGASDPELSADGKTVVYVQGAGTCASEIRSVPVTGGEPTTLARSNGDTVLHGPSMTSGGLAYVRSSCDGKRDEVVAHGGPLVEQVDGSVRGEVVLGERFIAYITVKGTATTLHAVDPYGELADVPTPAPEGCAWQAVTWGAKDGNDRPQLFVAASCSPSDEVVETRLYRFDSDGQNRTLLARIDVLGVTSLDYAEENLVIGTSFRGVDAAYSWISEELRRIPGVAQRPSWS